VLEFSIGRTNEEFSHLRLRVTAETVDALQEVLEALIPLGCHPRRHDDARLEPAGDGFVPEDFYSTTHHRTQIRQAGRWIDVAEQRMDAVIVVAEGQAGCRKLRDIRAGERVVCGVDGIRVVPAFQERDRLGFAFMTNDVSTERRVEVSVARVVKMMREVKAEGGRIVMVAGPVVVHSGGAAYLARLVRSGWVDGLLAGNALAVAEFLQAHGKVDWVAYPGLPSHPQHALACRQTSGHGGMLAFSIKGGLPAAKRMLSKVRVFTLAESLGGVESLIEHPALMTHASLSPQRRAELGIGDGLIRLSAGIESTEDLLRDLESALA
jgi:hypothetical protein